MFRGIGWNGGRWQSILVSLALNCPFSHFLHHLSSLANSGLKEKTAEFSTFFSDCMLRGDENALPPGGHCGA